jgi:hypothetical protein
MSNSASDPFYARIPLEVADCPVCGQPGDWCACEILPTPADALAQQSVYNPDREFGVDVERQLAGEP